MNKKKHKACCKRQDALFLWVQGDDGERKGRIRKAVLTKHVFYDKINKLSLETA